MPLLFITLSDGTALRGHIVASPDAMNGIQLGNVRIRKPTALSAWRQRMNVAIAEIAAVGVESYLLVDVRRWESFNTAERVRHFFLLGGISFVFFLQTNELRHFLRNHALDYPTNETEALVIASSILRLQHPNPQYARLYADHLLPAVVPAKKMPHGGHNVGISVCVTRNDPS